MKKLKLEALKLGTTELLTRAQMKNVAGGILSSGCSPACSSGYTCVLWPNTNNNGNHYECAKNAVTAS
jgi:hypothetical protein